MFGLSLMERLGDDKNHHLRTIPAQKKKKTLQSLTFNLAPPWQCPLSPAPWFEKASREERVVRN
jgi:hypothetical protein